MNKIIMVMISKAGSATKAWRRGMTGNENEFETWRQLPSSKPQFKGGKGEVKRGGFRCADGIVEGGKSRDRTNTESGSKHCKADFIRLDIIIMKRRRTSGKRCRGIRQLAREGKVGEHGG